MKQSTKLLSMLLALVLAFSCLSVIGSAALDKGAIKYDNIDDADLTYDQVATLALDLVDNDLLAGMDTIDLSIVGELRLDSIDHILADIKSLRSGLVWSIGKGLLGDIGDLNFKGLTVDPDNDGDALQRSNGDYAVISGLLRFISDNAGILSKAAYGLSGGDGISLGLVGSFLDLGDIGTMLNDIPGMLVGLVYDLLIYGSYGYDKSIDDIKEAKSTLKATYPEMDTLDEMVPNAIYNLLTKPQNYTWEGEGKDSVKVWDMDSIIMPGLKLTASDINPLSHSLFQILDTAAQTAIDEIGIPALNNNLKKALMLAVEADLNLIDYENLPADVKTYFDDTDAYETYFAYDRLMKSGGTWYYTTLETEVTEDPVTGEPMLDEEGNEITSKVREYYKVNMGAANEFASLINWDWEVLPAGATVTDADNQIVLDYKEIKAVNGSLVGGINKLIGMVYDVALTDAAKADFIAKVQEIDPENTTGWINNSGNDDLTTNVANLTKYILVSFGDRVFGSDSKYANYTWDQVKNLTVIDLVAMIGPEFFEDAMPQIILPKYEDGTYAFHQGVQLWEFAAIVLRELITGIAPGVNYDEVIFDNGDVTSEDDRLFAEHSADEWFDIILNMGTDLGLTYLGQLTNFKGYWADTDLAADYPDLDDYINYGVGGTDASHWQTSLDHAILWAVKYVGSADAANGVLNGISYNAVNDVDGPINKLSYILNTLLPLGFVGDGTYTSDDYDLDLSLVIEGLKDLLTNFNLNSILHLLGRNTTSKYNFLDDASLGTAVLDLVNDILYLVFGKTILQGVNATGTVTAQSLDNVISQASLKTTVNNLLTGLNDRKDAILKNALPVVGKLIKGWGTEQRFKSPVHNVPTHINVEDTGCSYWYETGKDCDDNPTYEIKDKDALSYSIRNGSDGMWRHYVKDGVEYKDDHYAIQIASVEFFNYDGSASSYIHSINIVDKGKIGYGGSGTFNFKVGSISTPDGQTRGSGSPVPETGVVQKMKIGYKIFVEDGSALLGGTVFYDESYVWLSRTGAVERVETAAKSDCYFTAVSSPFYMPYYEDDIQATLDNIKATAYGSFSRSHKIGAGSKADYSISVAQAVDTDGLTFGSPTANCTANEDLESISLRFFDTYSGDWKNQENGSDRGDFSVKGAVPTAAVFANNVPLSEVDSAAGASSSWVVNLRSKDNKADNVSFVLRYYNADYRALLLDLVADENNAQRKASDYKHAYNANATVEASEALINVDVPASESESGKFELRETNFAVGKNGVTVINCAQAWNNYYNALLAALNVGLQEWNPQSKFNFKEVYNALRVAVNDLEYCTATVDDGAESLGTTIDALEDQLRASQARTIDKYNHTDYEMYRHNRYNDARDDISGYVALKDDASPANVTYIDEYFDYSWMEEDDFRELVGKHTVKYGDDAGTTVAANQYETYLLALLEKYEEEEIEGKKEWLNNRKKDFANVSALDLAMASNYLTLTEDRLLRRTHGVITDQLEDEIASAENMIGTTNNGYTAGSWDNYIKAYDDAVAAVNSGSQKQVFDAKYQLLVQRKALVKVEDAGDYNELNALIANAQFALANPDLYDNTPKEFGQVLAELGMDPIVSVDGYDVQLFPGSALITVANAYGKEDQDKIDDAAWVLKEALARLKFKNLEVEDTTTGEIVESEVLVEADELKGIEEVSALISRISKETTEDAAKALFRVVASNLTSVTVDDIIVTNDDNFSVNYEGMDEFIGFAGTNSTITFYTTFNGVKLPVATVKVVVDGDINGDGVIDALDATYAALVASEKTGLEGCYLLAGDVVNGDRELTSADYSAIVNKAIA